MLAIEFKSDRSPLQLLHNPQEDQAAHVLCICPGLNPDHACCLVGGSVCVTPLSPRIVGSVDLMLSLTLYSLSPITHYFTRHPDLRLTLAAGLCICFHQLLDEASQMIVMLGSCLQA